MNRLPSPKASTGNKSQSGFGAAAKATASHRMGQAFRRSSRNAASPYSLFVPLHYESGYAYPLLVWLHGDGGCESELRQLMPHVSVRNYVGVSIRGNCTALSDGKGYSWDHSPYGAADAAERVHECITAAQERLNIHPDRIFIAGNGCGGTMALRVALRHPEWFAGAVSLCGPIPAGGSPLSRLNEARRLPLLLASCRDSNKYPPSRVAGDLRLLHSAGFSLALRQYPGECDLTTVMLSDLDRWVMDQVCPSSAAATHQS